MSPCNVALHVTMHEFKFFDSADQVSTVIEYATSATLGNTAIRKFCFELLREQIVVGRVQAQQHSKIHKINYKKSLPNLYCRVQNTAQS